MLVSLPAITLWVPGAFTAIALPAQPQLCPLDSAPALWVLVLSWDATGAHAGALTNSQQSKVEQELEVLCRLDAFSVAVERKQNLLQSVCCCASARPYVGSVGLRRHHGWQMELLSPWPIPSRLLGMEWACSIFTQLWTLDFQTIKRAKFSLKTKQMQMEEEFCISALSLSGLEC